MSRKKRLKTTGLSKVNHLYIHIPFCKSKCPYCDFFSVTLAGQKIKDRYTDALIKEVKHVSKTLATPLKSFYLGGGNPILIGEINLKKIIDAVKPYMSIRTEKSIEINPEHLGVLDIPSLGFNRVSVGVQTTNKKALKLIKRKYSMQQLIKNIRTLKGKGVTLSLDFMFALPGQTIVDLKRDIAFIKRTAPEHVSFYMFTPPKGYPLKHLLSDDKTIDKMFKLTHSALDKFGFIHYEVSNFAKNKKICRHNFAYWDKSSYLGLGAGAHSFMSDKRQRMWHGDNVTSYIKAPVTYAGKETLDKNTRKLEDIMLGLRLLNTGIPTSKIKTDRIKELIKNGIVEVNNKRIKIPAGKLILLDSIIEHICTVSLS